jgi:hypothetical protein
MADKAAGYKGHRKGSLSAKLREIYVTEGKEACKKAGDRMVARGTMSDNTLRSLLSFWGRGIVPGSKKPRGRKKPVHRVKSKHAQAATGTKRVKPKKAAKTSARRVAPKKAKANARKAVKAAKAVKRVKPKKAA